MIYRGYRNNDIRKRMIEYLGGTSLEKVTAAYVTRCDDDSFINIDMKPPGALDYFLDNGFDICRSLWDSEFLIADLDIEYVNFDFPDEPYLDLKRSFQIQEPVVRTIENILLRYSLNPLHLISGRGHHFLWRISRNSRAFRRISSLGHLSHHLEEIYSHRFSPAGESVSSELGAAFSGLGLIMEYMVYQIKEEASPICDLPVNLTAVTVGPRQRGREIVSLDISEYGDPLHTRAIRVPFSAYLKPWTKEKRLNKSVADRIPFQFIVPLHEMDILRAIEVMKDQHKIAELAKQVSTKIPGQVKGMERLVAAYKNSDVRRFHDWFYSQHHEPPDVWYKTYDLTPVEMLPSCVRRILKKPNDLLLRPAEIEIVVKSMLSLGWHPRHIAGLIRSKYERDYGWGEYWYVYDAGLRADFYTRIFTGLFVTGRDDLTDFNCVSAREKGLCPGSDEPCQLDEFRNSLLGRREYGRLASRPFNRLFLPGEHT